MPVNFIVVSSRNFPRSYVRGLAFLNGASNLADDGAQVTFEEPTGRTWQLVYKNNWPEWNSNVYSVGGVFDPTVSKHFVDGIEVGFGGMFVDVGYILNEGMPRILFSGYSLSTNIVTHDLPQQPSSYWRPLPGDPS